MRLLHLFAAPADDTPPAPCGTVKYRPDGTIEVSGYPMTDVLRFFDSISDAAASALSHADASGLSFTREGFGEHQ